MLVFNKINIQNFQSISKLEFTFESGVFLVSGKNGVGKSSIFEALLWCICDKSSKGKSVSTDDKGNCCVKVHFNKNNDNYIITRYQKHEEFSNKVFIEKNGQVIDTDVDTVILNETNMTYDMFTLLYILLQDTSLNFASSTPTSRKLMLEGLFSFVSWLDVKKKFDEESLLITNKIMELDNNIQNVRSSIISSSTSISNIEGIIDRIKNSNTFDVGKNEQRLNFLNSKDVELVSKLESFNINSIKKSKNDHLELLNKFSKEYSDHRSTLNTGYCSLCGVKYSEEKIKNSKEQIDFLPRKIDGLRVMLSNFDTKINEYDSIVSELYQIRAEADVIKRKITEYKSNTSNEIDHYSNKLSEFNAQLNNDNAIMLGLSEKRSVLVSEFDNVKLISSLMLPSSKFRTEMLSGYLDSVNECIQQIIDELFIEHDVKLTTSSNGIEIKMTRNKKSVKYKSFSIGERRIFDIVFIQAFKRFMYRVIGLNTNLMVFDEVFDGLDNDNVDLVLSVINQLCNDECIYVVSHKGDLKLKFENVISVDKYNNKTEVMVNGSF